MLEALDLSTVELALCALAALGIAGQISSAELRLGVALVPFTFLGLWAGLRLSDALDRGPLRPGCSRSPAPPGRSRSSAPCSDAGSV